jgi:NAD(P)-dependent dehydrogenase (short-subunit alcohol dehydrogenase family)
MNDTRTAVVTGASTGIGRAIALALGRAGFDLAVTDLDTEWLADLAAEPHLQGRKPSPARGPQGEREPTEFAARNRSRQPTSHAAADLPIAAFTRGMTSSAINCIERLLSAGSTQSMPA